MNSINIKKKIGENNPIIASRFMADPYAIYYEGKVYVYGSNDSDSLIDDNGSYPKNLYSNIKSLNCISSEDMVNWTDEGEIQVADDVKKGKKGAASWAGNSWAPAVCYNKVKDEATGEMVTKFFIYFANSAASIGVLTSDSPTGPWVDPLGKPMITHDVPGCKDIEWLFDPAVWVEEDGTAYIYFGGGVPQGKEIHPMTARVAKLAPDMISIEGEAVLIDAPYLFEDSGINKINGKYYYSYCTNWSNEVDKAMGKAQISYMISDNPMGPFEYKGEIMKNPGQSENFSERAWGNNHHCMLQIDDKVYMFYHAPQYEIDLNLPFNDKAVGGCAYRTTYVDVAYVHEDGTITVDNMTKAGTIAPLCCYNPYKANDAFVWAEGVTTVTTENNNVKPHITYENGGYIGIFGADIQKESGELEVTVYANLAEGTLTLYAGELSDSHKVSVVTVLVCNETHTYKTCIENIDCGITDLFIKYESNIKDAKLVLTSWKLS